METFDVLVVGGGPSGSTCAWKLHQAGLKTLVIDRKNFPRDKPCAGWITPQVVQSLALDVADYSSARTWQPITGFRCGLIGGKEIELDYAEPVSYGIRRYEFDRYLLERSGSQRMLNETVDKIERSGRNWLINERFCAPMLVGAGGTHCPVARMLGSKRKASSSTVVAQETEFKISEGRSVEVRGEVPRLYFCSDLLGYGWCFRKGDYLNVGLGRTDSRDFKAHVSNFQEFMSQRGIPCSDADQIWKGHSYQLYLGEPRDLFGDGVLLLGDAAGLAYPQSGEGIRPAIESGLIAADVIQCANGDYRSNKLLDFRHRLESQLGKPQQPGILSRLPASWLALLATRLLVSPWFSRHVVMDRWFLRSR